MAENETFCEREISQVRVCDSVTFVTNMLKITKFVDSRN